MDITVSWSPVTYQVGDIFNIYYKAWDSNNLNTWILANPTPLPQSVTTYTITGLDPNTVYRIGLFKTCDGITNLPAGESSFISIVCPIMSVYQGPITNGNATLYYSLSYPNANHITGATVNVYETPVGNNFYNSCPTPAVVPYGRDSYLTFDSCDTNIGSDIRNGCNAQYLSFSIPTSLNSAVSYYGLDTSGSVFNPFVCDGAINNPILFEFNKQYIFEVQSTINQSIISTSIDFIKQDPTCITASTAFTYTTLPNIPLDYTRMSGVFDWDINTGQVRCYFIEGTGQTVITQYSFDYITDDALGSSPLPLVNNAGVPVTTPYAVYTTYVPVHIDPLLDPASLTNDMFVRVTLYNPNPNYIYITNDADFQGFTINNMLANIAGRINQYTPYTASSVVIGGQNYIKINVPGTLITSASIDISGPTFYEYKGQDLLQTAVTPPTYGSQSAFLYNVSGDDYIYGARTYPGVSGGIDVTKVDTVTPSTVSYNHGVFGNFADSKVLLVDVAPASEAHSINHLDSGNPLTAIAYKSDIAGISWNWGYVYVASTSVDLVFNIYLNTVKVYDTGNNLIDTWVMPGAPVGPIRQMEFNQQANHLYMILEDLQGGNHSYYVVEHAAVGTWNPISGGNCLSSNVGCVSQVTGFDDYYTVPFAAANQWSLNCRIAATPLKPSWSGFPDPSILSEWCLEILSCAANPAVEGRQLILSKYCPTCTPPSNTPATDNDDTIYIDPFNPINAGWNTILQPGDTFAVLGPYYDRNIFFDWTASWTQNYNEWNIVVESGSGLGIFGKVTVDGINKLATVNSDVNGWYNEGLGGSRKTSYGTYYRIFKVNDGQLKWNLYNGYMYHSCGNGKVQLWNPTGNYHNVYQFLDFASQPQKGSFQMAFHEPTIGQGDMYAIMRDSTVNGNTSDPGDHTTQVKSPGIFILLDSGGGIFNLGGNIPGNVLWGEDIAGGIEIINEAGQDYAYFTSDETRKIYKWKLNFAPAPGYLTINSVPSVYNKINNNTLELLCGVKYHSPGKFVIINRVKGTITNSLYHHYDFTNLFIYDFPTNDIVQVLVGADALSPLVIPPATWNPDNYGQRFGEFNYFKDYVAGGMSIIVANNYIFWMDSLFKGLYYSYPWPETGVAQLWSISADADYRVIRIYNIQSDSSLVGSYKSIIFSGAEQDDTTSGITDMVYSSYYNAVVGMIEDGSFVQIIEPNKLTGYWGNNGVNTHKDTTYKLCVSGLYPTTYPNNIYNTKKITVDDITGNIYLLGNKANSSDFTYQVWTPFEITGTNIYTPPALAGLTGDSSVIGPGVFETGAYLPNGNPSMNWPHLFVASQNEIWTVATETATLIVPIVKYGDQIVAIYDAQTMTLEATIPLKATGNLLPYFPALNYEYNHIYIPAINKVVLYQGDWTTNRFIIIDAATKNIDYSGPINVLLNQNRPIPLVNQNIGAVIPYNTGFYIDINESGSSDEYWTYIDIAGSLTTYTGLTHNIITANIQSNAVLSNDNVYTLGTTAFASGFPLGQWKELSSGTWVSMVSGSTITINPNEVIEFTMFNPANQIIRVVNVTQNITYDITDPLYLNVNTLPKFSTQNSMAVFTIQADNVNMFNNDQFELYFTNPDDPTLPFVNYITISF